MHFLQYRILNSFKNNKKHPLRNYFYLQDAGGGGTDQEIKALRERRRLLHMVRKLFLLSPVAHRLITRVAAGVF